MKTLVRTVLVFTVLAATFIVGTGTAWACTCAPLNVRQTLTETDGAFVGELVARKDPVMLGPVVGPGTSVFTFRVNRSFKGELGELVQVESESDGAACGLEVAQGDRTGLFLMREENRWRSNLCLQVEPQDLRAAARSIGAGEAAAAPDDTATDTAPASEVSRQGSPVWPWVLIALAVVAPMIFFALRARRSSGR